MQELRPERVSFFSFAFPFSFFFTFFSVFVSFCFLFFLCLSSLSFCLFLLFLSFFFSVLPFFLSLFSLPLFLHFPCFFLSLLSCYILLRTHDATLTVVPQSKAKAASPGGFISSRIPGAKSWCRGLAALVTRRGGAENGWPRAGGAENGRVGGTRAKGRESRGLEPGVGWRGRCRLGARKPGKLSWMLPESIVSDDGLDVDARGVLLRRVLLEWFRLCFLKKSSESEDGAAQKPYTQDTLQHCHAWVCLLTVGYLASRSTGDGTSRDADARSRSSHFVGHFQVHLRFGYSARWL